MDELEEWLTCWWRWDESERKKSKKEECFCQKSRSRARRNVWTCSTSFTRKRRISGMNGSSRKGQGFELGIKEVGPSLLGFGGLNGKGWRRRRKGTYERSFSPRKMETKSLWGKTKWISISAWIFKRTQLKCASASRVSRFQRSSVGIPKGIVKRSWNN